MGDIARHRDIFFNTRDAIPTSLLDQCRLTRNDLTFLELGNFLTDVSQFRDPVTYIFAKRRIWHEKILPKVPENRAVQVVQALVALSAFAAAAVLQSQGRAVLGTLPLAVPAIQGLAAKKLYDALADLDGLDEWIDKMFGKPFERIRGNTNKRADADYGLVGQFFQLFIEGITHLLFSSAVTNRVPGTWETLDRIPEADVSAVYRDFFTQYYPHEHTDQPPYVWDASQRHKKPQWYAPSRRQRDLVNRDIGIMNVVDKDYVRYLSEELSKLEAEFRGFTPGDAQARRRWLVRLGKILHGVEDWYFHSNVVELVRLRSFRRGPQEGDEEFLRRFVANQVSAAATFLAQTNGNAVEFQRRLYRTLRFPKYDPADKSHTAGRLNKKESTLSLNHAYPAFPSQQDTAHTLLGALGNLEERIQTTGSSTPATFPPWLVCVLLQFFLEGGDVRRVIDAKTRARGTTPLAFHASLLPGGTTTPAVRAARIDVLRELLPLVLTLLHESERQRLNANVGPLEWPDRSTGPRGTKEKDEQLKLHRKALEPKMIIATPENNYQRAARYLNECGFIDRSGRDQLVQAFKIDAESEELHSEAPGAGGFLIEFALELQGAVDQGKAEANKLNRDTNSVFNQASDNGSFNEIIGSHSLMSKDTKESSPFFDDARVLASVASQSVLHIMLEEVSAPAGTDGLRWEKILHHFIRYPVATAEWEHNALTFFRQNGRIPTFADLPELARLKTTRLPTADLQRLRTGTKAVELEREYIQLEKKLSHYRY